jgi:predicted nucleic acid-binding protein
VRALVVDASALVDLLLRTSRAGSYERTLSHSESDLHTPALCDLEVLSAVRSGVRRKELSVSRALEALQDHLDLPLTRHGHQNLLPRCFQLRDVLSPYDAAYVALAEGLGAELVTADRRMVRAAEALGISCLLAGNGQ